MTFVIAVPTLNLVTTEFLQSFINLQYPQNTQGQIIFIKNLTTAQARQGTIEFCIKNNIDFVLFIDDDVLFPKYIFKKLFLEIERNKADMISGVYYTKEKNSVPLILKKLGDGMFINYPQNKIITVKGCAMGCSLHRIEAYKKLIEKGITKFYESKRDSIKDKHTEDVFFFRIAKKNNLKILVDTSIQCGHIDRFDNFKIYFKGKDFKFINEIELNKLEES